MSFFKKAQEKLAELQESQSEENWEQREQRRIQAQAFNERSRPPRLIYEDIAHYYGGHPAFAEYDKNTAGSIYITQDGICWVGYPIRLIIPWTWITALNLMPYKSTSFTQEFIEGLNKGMGQQNGTYNTVLVVDFMMENVSYQALFHFNSSLTRGMAAEKAKTFVEKTIPFKRFFHAPAGQFTMPVASAKGELSTVEALERLAALHAAGHLSEQEYQQLKAKLISGL